MSHVVAPSSIRCPLSDGSSIEIKKELNAGEYFDLITDLAARKAYSKLVAYIIGWSLIGADGQPLPYALDMSESARRDTIRALNVRTMREIVAIIDRHEEAEDRAFDAKKKTSAESPASNPTYASVAP